MNKDYFLQSHLEKLCSKNYYHLKLGGGFKYFLFSPLPGEDEPILTHIFQIGWFNHQLESLVRESFPQKIINDMFPQIHLHQFCLNKLHNFTSTTAPAMPLGAWHSHDRTPSMRRWRPRHPAHGLTLDVRRCRLVRWGKLQNPLVLYVFFCQKFANKNNCLEISSALFF